MNRFERSASWLGWGLAASPLVLGCATAMTPLRKLYDAPWYAVPATALDWVTNRFHADPDVTRWAPIVGAATAVFCLAPAIAALTAPLATSRHQLRARRDGDRPVPPVRANSSLHGNADWMPERDLMRLARGGDPDHGGVVYGTACRGDLHPGQDGGAAPLLVDRCLEDATHGQVYFGSGGGKTSAVTIPTLDPDAGWRGNVLVNDPSSQAGAMCADMRRDFGQRVVFLGLERPRPRAGQPAQPPRVGIDIFAGLHPQSATFEQDVFDMVEALGTERSATPASNPDSGMFKLQGRALQRCLLADLLADPSIPASLRTPLGLVDRVATPERQMKGLLETIHAESSSRLARKLAGTLMEAPPKTFSGFCIEATADLNWLMIETYAAFVSGAAPGSITADEFAHGDMCAFLQLGVKTMEGVPQVGRAVLNALLGAIYRADGAITRRTLLLLDERVLFGKLKALSTLSSQGRKYGITCINMWHGPAQVDDLLGKGEADTLRTNSSWEIYSALDSAAAKVLSERLGTYTALAPSEGHSSGSQVGSASGSASRGKNQGVTLQARRLVTPDEIEFGLRRDEQIVFRRGAAAPARCVKAYYFRRPEMAAKVQPDPYRPA